MAEGKKSTGTKSLPLVSCFHPLHKLQLPKGFLLEGCCVFSSLWVPGRCSRCGAHHWGTPGHSTLPYFCQAKHHQRRLRPEGWFLLLFLPPFGTKHNPFCVGWTGRLWALEAGSNASSHTSAGLSSHTICSAVPAQASRA